jgi:hypothetical protein
MVEERIERFGRSGACVGRFFFEPGHVSALRQPPPEANESRGARLLRPGK